MSKSNTIVLGCLCLALLFGCFVLIQPQTATADDAQSTGELVQRLFTDVELSLSGGDGKVWATATHTFTLFSATVEVTLEIYQSETYTSSYTDMTLVATESVSNLAEGDSLVCTASTEGKSMYWNAVMCYKVNNGSWKYRSTGTVLASATGEIQDS